MAQDLVIKGETYTGVENLAAINTNGEKVFYFEAGAGSTGTITATHDGNGNVTLSGVTVASDESGNVTVS